MADALTAHSRIRDVVDRVPDGRDLLRRYGYELGEGFIDQLSQYQTLEDAFREGRLRDLPGMINAANNASQK